MSNFNISGLPIKKEKASRSEESLDVLPAEHFRIVNQANELPLKYYKQEPATDDSYTPDESTITEADHLNSLKVNNFAHGTSCKSAICKPALNFSNVCPDENANNLQIKDGSLSAQNLKKSDVRTTLKSELDISFIEDPVAPESRVFSTSAIQRLIAEDLTTSQIINYLTDPSYDLPVNSRTGSVTPPPLPRIKITTASDNTVVSIGVKEGDLKSPEDEPVSPVYRPAVPKEDTMIFNDSVVEEKDPKLDLEALEGQKSVSPVCRCTVISKQDPKLFEQTLLTHTSNTVVKANDSKPCEQQRPLSPVYNGIVLSKKDPISSELCSIAPASAINKANHSKLCGQRRSVSPSRIDNVNVKFPKTSEQRAACETTVVNQKHLKLPEPTSLAPSCGNVVSKTNVTKCRSVSPVCTGTGVGQKIVPSVNVVAKAENPTSNLKVPVCRCSSTALAQHPSGKLPIETTEVELIWGCVPVGKSEIRDFLLRNASSRRLQMQLSVTGRQFKLRHEDIAIFDRTVNLIMKPRETKKVMVSLLPTVTGAAVDVLVFTNLSPEFVQTVRQRVRLYGYGGLDQIEIKGIPNYPNDKIWLALGKLNNDDRVNKSLFIKNTGELAAFVHITFKSEKHFVVNIEPKLFTIDPQEARAVLVTYKPTRKDIHSFRDSLAVIDLGSLMVTSGAEATRGRIRRLCRKNEEAGDKVDSLAHTLREEINGESIPADLSHFKEQAMSLKRVMKCLKSREVVVTVERGSDPTSTEDIGMMQTFFQNTVIANTKLPRP